MRSVPDLQVDNRKLAGLLDPANEEILYEENDPPSRQNFSIAHEIGHYFLHYLPAKEESELPSLFSQTELDAVSTGTQQVKFFRCSEDELEIQTDVDEQVSDETKKSSPLKAAMDNPERQQKLANILRFYTQHKRRERQANAFASALLMPPELVRWLKTKHGGDLWRMASELKVSQEALFYRLEYLKEASDISRPKFLNRKPKDPPANQGTFF